MDIKVLWRHTSFVSLSLIWPSVLPWETNCSITLLLRQMLQREFFIGRKSCKYRVSHGKMCLRFKYRGKSFLHFVIGIMYYLIGLLLVLTLSKLLGKNKLCSFVKVSSINILLKNKTKLKTPFCHD